MRARTQDTKQNKGPTPVGTQAVTYRGASDAEIKNRETKPIRQRPGSGTIAESMIQKLGWALLSIVGALGLAGIALNRDEHINSMWLIVASVSIYLTAYRFYAKFIEAKVMALDDRRATPAERLRDGHDFEPTNKWIVFGHHFAAIAGPGPLVGPTLAAQFGYLPGTLWIIVGAALGGCVQDFVILFCSMRRDGKTLGQMAREEIGKVGGVVALVTVLLIMVILLAVVALVVVNALAHSPWGTFTIFATMPIAVFMGLYLRYLRPGKVLECSAIGFALVIASIFGGEAVANSPEWAPVFTYSAVALALMVIAYGFLASSLPVWLLLAPRDYLSTFVKLGVVVMLAVGILFARPELQMPAYTKFIDGSGPVFAGKIFPFCFITIACGAISGFHALISSGTTPKLIARESHATPVGYGSMLLESFVAIMAMIAACVLDPGVYFAVNSPAGIAGATPELAAATITAWGFPVDAAKMASLAKDVGEQTLFYRTGGAPSLALDHIHKPLGRTNWMPGVIGCSALVVGSWGYFLYQGVKDPLGGVNTLWPLFGIANQLLASIALCVATTILLKMHRAKYLWITCLPLSWLLIVTYTAALEKIFSDLPRVGFLAQARQLEGAIAAGKVAAAKVADTQTMIFNAQLDAGICVVFLILVSIIVIDSARVWIGILRGNRDATVHESPFVLTQLKAEEV